MKAKDLSVMKNEETVNPNRGFITIATGDEKYHKMAYILLWSYRLTSDKPCKFAVITDKPSRYTESFDDVIVMPDATKSYMDKIDLLINAPYDESIFIDSDCIAYRDLNQYWSLFENASDFSCFGHTLGSVDSRFFLAENMPEEYKGKIKYGISMHGGVYYIKKSREICESIHALSYDIIKNYASFKFTKFQKPADEPILALAMVIYGCRPVEARGEFFVWLKRAKNVKADFFKKTIKYTASNGDFISSCALIHFGTSRTILPLYLREAQKVKFYQRKKRVWSWPECLIYSAWSWIKGGSLLIINSRKLLMKRFKI